MTKPTIVFSPNSYGGVLKYYGSKADELYWDTLWKEAEHSADYERAQKGHLSRHLRATFLRWAPPGSKVLEAGCGLATFTIATRALGYETDGVDFAPEVIQRLRQKFPDIHFAVGDVRNLDGISEGAYDAVYSPGVCEHFEEGPDAILQESWRILKPGGVLLVSTPCFNSFRRVLYRLGKFRGPAAGMFYQHAFSDREMKKRLEAAGFDVIQSYGKGSWKTTVDHIPLIGKLPIGPLERPLAVLLDTMPVTKSWGHSRIWVGRKQC
jgi:SAM-dependent methyltransferase